MSLDWYVSLGPLVQCKLPEAGVDRDALDDRLTDILVHIDKEQIEYLPGDSHVYISNWASLGPNYSSENFLLEITPEMIQKQLDLFREQHREELTFLEEHYSEVRLLWGAISSWN